MFRNTKDFISNNSQKLTLLSSAALALFSLGVLVSVNRPPTGINEGIISDRVLGESSNSFPYLLEFLPEDIKTYEGSEVMVAGSLGNIKGKYQITGESNSQLKLQDYKTSGAIELSDGEETKAIVVGELNGVQLDVKQVFFVPSVISSDRLLSIVARELEPYRDCIECKNDDILRCIGNFRIDSKAVVTPSGSAINLDYALITSEDEFYRVSLNILNNQNLVFQDASNLDQKCS